MAVVVAQHPDDLGLAALAQAADVREQPPGVGAEMAEAPVVEDVAEQDQPLEAPLLEHREQVARPGRRQAECRSDTISVSTSRGTMHGVTGDAGVDCTRCGHWPSPGTARPRPAGNGQRPGGRCAGYLGRFDDRVASGV